MRIHPWLILTMAASLLAACSGPTTVSSNDPETGSLQASAPALATAQVIQRPIADRVVPLTPTPTAEGVILVAAADSPTPAPAITATTNPTTPVDAAAMGDDPAALESLLVASINQVRAANGLPPYQHSPELSVAARAHSCDLAAHGQISHTSSDGRTLAQRLEGANPPWEWPSESIAAGSADPATIVAWWMDEPPDGWHRRNILDADQREVGAGYCYLPDDPTGNHYYWTADFSRRATT
ncbi:MAG TPA: CAP domain-containing protein [Roseiflexaceae bacterium]|nr:CAP domain-containing protein [Roseiflexaceae bacterium]